MTKAQKWAVTALWDSRLSVAEIASSVGADEKQVLNFARRHRSECPSRTKFLTTGQISRMRDLRNAGCSAKAIAQQMDMSVSSVYSAFKNHGIRRAV